MKPGDRCQAECTQYVEHPAWRRVGQLGTLREGLYSRFNIPFDFRRSIHVIVYRLVHKVCVFTWDIKA